MNTVFKKNLPGDLMNVATILIVAIMLIVTQATAKTEQTSQALNEGVLSYQGTLMDTAGNPVTGSYDMTFRIYNSLTSTTPLWEEVRTGVNAVPVQNGLFNVMLGSLHPIPGTVWEETEQFLGVKIGNDIEMAPREKLTVVPGATVAQMALTAANDSIAGDQIVDGTITQQDAPSLIKSAESENVEIYFGRNTIMSSGTQGVLVQTITIPSECNEMVDAIIQPQYNWSPYVNATTGSPWDGGKITVFLHRTDGTVWDDGQAQSYSYIIVCQK